MEVFNSRLFWICMMLPLVVFTLDVSPATPEDELDESEDTDAMDDEEDVLGPWSANNGTTVSDYDYNYKNEYDSLEALQPGETEEEEEDDEEGGLDRMVLGRALRPEGARCRRLSRRVCQLGLYCKMYRICTTTRPCRPGATCPRRCQMRGVCTRRNPSSTTAKPRTTTRRARRRTRRTTTPRPSTTPTATTKASTARRRTTPKA